MQADRNAFSDTLSIRLRIFLSGIEEEGKEELQKTAEGTDVTQCLRSIVGKNWNPRTKRVIL